MKNKFNPELLKEELKKFKILSEWDFYQESEKPELLYGNKVLDEADEENPDAAADDIAGDLGVDAPDDAPADDMGGDVPPPDDMGGGDDMGAPPAGDAPPAPAPMPEPAAPAPMPEPAAPEEDVEEVDITDLVQDSKRTKQTSFMANQHTKMLLQKFEELEARVSQMDRVTQQIEDLEHEIIKRNPTPVENLEMQTIHSAPYTQKLSDYWADKEGPYDVMHNKNKPKEYILTQDDVDSDYSDINVRKSFGASPDEYEEEDY